MDTYRLNTRTLEQLNAQMAALIAGLSTQQIFDSVIMIGGGDVTPESRLSRTRLLAEYERRNGGEAVDKLMAFIGL